MGAETLAFEAERSRPVPIEAATARTTSTAERRRRQEIDRVMGFTSSRIAASERRRRRKPGGNDVPIGR
jgi:hypothetical protein